MANKNPKVPTPRRKGPVPLDTTAKLRRYETVVNYYLTNGFSKKKALLSAGYAESVATRFTAHVFDHPWVKAEIARRMKVASDKADITLEWWLQKMKAIAESGDTLNPYKKAERGVLRWDLDEAPPEALALINNFETSVRKSGGEEEGSVETFKPRITEPIEALNAIGRHLGAFNDKIDLNHNMSVAEQIMRGRERVRQLETKEPDGA